MNKIDNKIKRVLCCYCGKVIEEEKIRTHMGLPIHLTCENEMFIGIEKLEDKTREKVNDK